MRAQPRITVNPASITRSDPRSGGPVEVAIEISNQEWGNMDWTLTEAASWISLSRASGTYVTGHPSVMRVTLDPAGVSAGLQQADILVNSPGAINSPQTVHVAWTLQEGPALVVSPTKIDFQAQVGGSNPAPQSLA